jgi:hypothetical protein
MIYQRTRASHRPRLALGRSVKIHPNSFRGKTAAMRHSAVERNPITLANNCSKLLGTLDFDLRSGEFNKYGI